jgi:hypothetical protein
MHVRHYETVVDDDQETFGNAQETFGNAHKTSPNNDKTFGSDHSSDRANVEYSTRAYRSHQIRA